MGGFSLTHWLVVLVIVLIVFGAGKLPQVMGDLAKGVRSFKAGLRDDGEEPPPSAKTAVERAARVAEPAREGGDTPPRG